MKPSDYLAIVALLISLSSLFYSYRIDSKAEYSRCIDNVKEFPQELYDLGKEYSKYLNRYLAVDSSKNLQMLKSSTRQYVNYLDGVNSSLSKYSCSSEFQSNARELTDFIMTTTSSAINRKDVEITSVVNALDKISKFEYRPKCCVSAP